MRQENGRIGDWIIWFRKTRQSWLGLRCSTFTSNFSGILYRG